MRYILTLLISIFTLSLQAQKDCSIQPSSHIPLIDLQGQNYRGYLGGLYAKLAAMQFAEGGLAP